MPYITTHAAAKLPSSVPVAWWIKSECVQRKAIVLLVTKFLVSGVLLALVVASIDTRAVLRTMRTADIGLLLLWFASIPIANALAAWRWS